MGRRSKIGSGKYVKNKRRLVRKRKNRQQERANEFLEAPKYKDNFASVVECLDNDVHEEKR